MNTRPTKLVQAMQRNQQIAQNLTDKLIINAYNGLAARLPDLMQTGNTYHQNMWDEVGYPTEVTFDMLYKSFSRNGFAYAGVMTPVDYGWKDNPKITDGDVDSQWTKETEFILKQYKLLKKLRGADWRNRIGEYSAFIIQIQSDDKNQIDWSQPLTEDIKLEQIVRFIPVNQGQLKPSSFWPDNDSRYPNPMTYNFSESENNDKQDAGTQTLPRSFTVHADRVITFAEGADDDTIHGRPANLAGYNSLLDLEKICASGSEGFWQAVKDNYIASLIAAGKTLEPKEKDDITKRFDEMSAGLHKAAVVGNWNIDRINKPLPSNYKDVLMNPLFQYCASINTPVSVVVGQITGVLAGDKDQMQFNDMINSRRENWQNEMIEDTLSWMDEHCSDYSLPDGLVIEWPDMNESSFSDKVESVDKLANALDKLANTQLKAGIDLTNFMQSLDEVLDVKIFSE